jgi:hypothetical protein
MATLVESEAAGDAAPHLGAAQKRVLVFDCHVFRLVGDELEARAVGVEDLGCNR